LNAPAVTSFVYGSLVVLGGWIGFKKAGSRPSLISGTASGALLLLAGALCLGGNAAGGKLAISVAFLLLAFFGYRFARGKKFMPAGMMAAISLLALAILYFTTS
jgi:uncharacterized membrane protein (UPF0136 family)